MGEKGRVGQDLDFKFEPVVGYTTFQTDSIAYPPLQLYSGLFILVNTA